MRRAPAVAGWRSIGRASRIRTYDLPSPRRTRYQTAPYSERGFTVPSGPTFPSPHQPTAEDRPAPWCADLSAKTEDLARPACHHARISPSSPRMVIRVIGANSWRPCRRHAIDVKKRDANLSVWSPARTRWISGIGILVEDLRRYLAGRFRPDRGRWILGMTLAGQEGTGVTGLSWIGDSGSNALVTRQACIPPHIRGERGQKTMRSKAFHLFAPSMYRR